MNSKYQPLFTPYHLNNGVTIDNRLTVAPLTIYDSGPDGEVTPAGRRFWHERIRGFGLWIMPTAHVHPSGIGFSSPNAFNERHLPALREIAEIAHEQGVKAIAQIGHDGSRAIAEMTQGYGVIGPTADVSLGSRAMTENEVEMVIDAFGYAAELCMTAGFDGVEIHGANGYLIQQFYSATTNQRSDDWGGTLEKRLRFPLAVVDSILKMREKRNRPDFIVGYRFSPEEPGKLGITMKETLNLVEALLHKEIQYLHVSMWNFYQKVRRGADTNLSRLQVLHELIGGKLPLISPGGLYTADDMLRAYSTGFVESVSIGKSVLLNPNLALMIQEGREGEIQTTFDWEKESSYRYTPAMLKGTMEGLDFYPPSKQVGILKVRERF